MCPTRSGDALKRPGIPLDDRPMRVHYPSVVQARGPNGRVRLACQPGTRRSRLMKRQLFGSIGTVAIVIGIVSLMPAPAAAGQTGAAATKDGKAYTAPRTAEGQPDLQGVWANNDATPLERPKQLEGRQFLTEAEVAALKKRAGELFNGETDA